MPFLDEGNHQILLIANENKFEKKDLKIAQDRFTHKNYLMD
jgi:hypothetical protein